MEKKRTDLEAVLHACRSSFISIGLFSMFVNLLMLTPAIYMLQVYDRVVTSGSESTLLMLTLVMLLMMGTMGGLENGRILAVTSCIKLNIFWSTFFALLFG